MVESMPAKSRYVSPLTIIVLVAVVLSQLAVFAPGHSDDHTKHCCPVCHAAHVALLRAVAQQILINAANSPHVLAYYSDGHFAGRRRVDLRRFESWPSISFGSLNRPGTRVPKS